MTISVGVFVLGVPFFPIEKGKQKNESTAKLLNVDKSNKRIIEDFFSFLDQ